MYGTSAEQQKPIVRATEILFDSGMMRYSGYTNLSTDRQNKKCLGMELKLFQ